MLLAKLVCSDPECPEELEVAIDDLRELDGLVCECGHGFVLLQIAELERPDGEVISIATRRPSRREQRRAA